MKENTVSLDPKPTTESGSSICVSNEDSGVKQVINSISGGACFGWLAAASIGASTTNSYALTALGVALALAITAWVWER